MTTLAGDRYIVISADGHAGAQVREYRDWVNTDHDLYDAVASEMHARGAMPEPDSREPWFLCAAHDDADEAKALEAFEGSLDDALEERAHGG